jgi:hypothetical protein
MTSMKTDLFLFAATAALITAWQIKKVAAAEQSCDTLQNSAFVFVKPHANTAPTQKLVRDKLVEAGIKILSEKDIDGKQIDKEKLIDQHYYAIGELIG